MIEAATAAHAEALAEIHAASFPPRERWGPDAMALQLLQHGSFGLVDGRGAMLLARAVADEAEILTLAVIPALRRLGLGRALLAQAAAQAQAAGAGVLFLEVSTENRPGCALYASCGFVQVSLRRAYYPGGGDALVMRRALSPAAATGG